MQETVDVARRSAVGTDRPDELSRQALSVTGARKSFGGVEALRGVDLHLEPGRLLAVLGRSGCGKSTLLRCIAGLERPDAGRIVIDGRTVDEGRTHVTPAGRNLGMVFQSYALWPHMTVLGNVTFGLRARKVDKRTATDRAITILHSLDLANFADRRPDQLSGGQQQRVALARALAASSSLILFDEPLSNLDAGLRLDVRRTVRKAQAEFGFSGVWVTHDQEEALAIADIVAVISEGSLLGCGTTGDMFRRPPNSGVAAFLGDNNLLPARRLDGRAAAWDAGGWRFDVDPSSPADGDVAVVPADAIAVHEADGCGRDHPCNSARVLDAEFKGISSYLLLETGDQQLRALTAATGVAPGQEVHVDVLGRRWLTRQG